MYVIETERLRLRRLTPSDRADVLSVLTNEAIMSAMHLPASEEFADQWMRRMIDRYKSHGSANWYAERRADGRFVGIIGVVMSEIDGVRCAELGYLIHPEFQRQGYAYEGAKACMDYAFRTLHADYVTASVAADNLPSMCLTEKLGLFPIEERVYRQHGKDTTYILYGLNNPE